MRFSVFLVGLASAVSVGMPPRAASALSPYLVVPDPRVAEASPAYRYANMTDAEAYAELLRRGIAYARANAQAPGVRAPIRLASALHGVYVHSSLPLDQRAQSPFEILDARLALALDDFCALLQQHDVDELVHFTMYRPEAAAPRATPTHRRSGAPSSDRRGAPKKIAKREAPAALVRAASSASPGTRHPAGLAIDVASFHKRDGRWVSVQGDFHGRLGAKTCGDGVPTPPAGEARELHALVCDSLGRGTFTYVLTPNYDAAQHDHFHMEIKPGVRWFLYH